MQASSRTTHYVRVQFANEERQIARTFGSSYFVLEGAHKPEASFFVINSVSLRWESGPSGWELVHLSAYGDRFDEDFHLIEGGSARVYFVSTRAVNPVCGNGGKIPAWISRLVDKLHPNTDSPARFSSKEVTF